MKTAVSTVIFTLGILSSGCGSDERLSRIEQKLNEVENKLTSADEVSERGYQETLSSISELPRLAEIASF